MWTNCTANYSTYRAVGSIARGIKIEFSTGEIVGVSLLNGVSSLVGTVGNLLVLVAVASNRILRTRPDFFIASLAFADLLVTLLNQPMFIYHINFYEETKGTYYGETTFFKIMALVGHIALLASVSNIFAVTVDRLISIRCPLKYQLLVTPKRVLVAISVAWFVSLAISIGYTVYMATGSEPNRLFLWCYCTFLLLATVSIYVYILAVARRQGNKVIILGTREKGKTETSVFSTATHTCNSELAMQPKRENKATKTVAIVLGVFLLMWLPLVIFASSEGWRESSAWFIRKFQWFHTISMCNSCFNPYIYCMRSERYKSVFARYFGCYLRVRTKSRNAPEVISKMASTTVQQTNEATQNV